MRSSDDKRGNRFRALRIIVEGVVYRFRIGIAWRDLPERFGPWQTRTRHRRDRSDAPGAVFHRAVVPLIQLRLEHRVQLASGRRMQVVLHPVDRHQDTLADIVRS